MCSRMQHNGIQDSHHGPILHSRIMRQAKDAPQDQVLILDGVVPGSRVGHAVFLGSSHEGVSTAGVQLFILVPGDPQVVTRELGSFGLDATTVGQEQLRWRRDELVGHRRPTDGIELARVLNLEDTIVPRRRIKTGRAPNLGLADFVEIALWVCLLVEANWERLLLHEGVILSVYGWIDPQAEDMLVVLCEGARVNHFPPASTCARIDIDNGHNSRGPDLCSNAGGLIEFKVENVLVVCKRDDELDDKLAAARDNGTIGLPIRVFPAYTVVLFVKTYHILRLVGGATGINEYAVEVLEFSQVSMGLLYGKEAPCWFVIP